MRGVSGADVDGRSSREVHVRGVDQLVKPAQTFCMVSHRSSDNTNYLPELVVDSETQSERMDGVHLECDGPLGLDGCLCELGGTESR